MKQFPRSIEVVDLVDQKRQRYDFLKLIFLSAAFFCIIGAYTVVRELKNCIFVYVVGLEWIPLAKILSMLVLVPLIFLYSRLVDVVHRYWLLCGYASFYGLSSFIFAYYLGHPEIGLSNVSLSVHRLLGWLFYFFVEGFSPFVVGVFWAFTNSISNPDQAKKGYGLIIASSKLGGLLFAGLAWYALGLRNGDGYQLYSDALNHQSLLVASALLLLCVPVIVFAMISIIPVQYLHGYEAAYRVEKKKHEKGVWKTGVFAGFKLLIKYPYVMSIFGMLFFNEICTTVLSYVSIGVAQASAQTPTQALRYLLAMIFYTQLVGFFIAVFVTGRLFERFGMRVCLMLVPFGAACSFLIYLLNGDSANALIVCTVMLRSIHTAFSWPLRESLYIPVVKDIKFKSKAWIDAFGGKCAKAAGSGVNVAVRLLGSSMALFAYSFFFGGIVLAWSGVAYLLGKRFEQAVANNEVIGIDPESKNTVN